MDVAPWAEHWIKMVLDAVYGRVLYSTLFQEKPPERKLIFWAIL